MSKITHLITRNKQFYYVIRIATDLKQYFLHLYQEIPEVELWIGLQL